MYPPQPAPGWAPSPYPPAGSYPPQASPLPPSGGAWPPGYSPNSSGVSPTSTGSSWNGTTGAYNGAPPGYPNSSGAYSSTGSFSSGSGGYGSPYSSGSGWPPASNSPTPVYNQPSSGPPQGINRSYSHNLPSYSPQAPPPSTYNTAPPLSNNGYPSGYPPSSNNNNNNGYGNNNGGGSSFNANPFSAPANPYSLPPSNNPYSAPATQQPPPFKSQGSFSQLPVQQQQMHPNTPVGPYGAPLAAVQATDAYSPKTGRPDNVGISPMQQLLMKEHEEELARKEARKKSESEAAAKKAAQEALQRRETSDAQNQAFLYQIEMDRIEREAESARKQLEEQQKAALSAEEQRRNKILEQMARENAEIEAKKRAEQRKKAEAEEARLRSEQEKLDQRQAALAAKERQLASAAERARQEELDAQRARDAEMAREAEEAEKMQQSFYSSILDLTKILATTNQRIIKLITLSYDDLVATGTNSDPDSDPKIFLQDLLGHLEKTSGRLIGMIHDNVMNVDDEIHSSIASSVQGMENSISSLVSMCKRLMSSESDSEISSWSAEERQSNAKKRSAAVSYAIKNLVDILAKMKIEEASSTDASTTKVLSAHSKEEAANNVERQLQAQAGERNRIAVQMGITSKRPVILADLDTSTINLSSYDLNKVVAMQRLIHHWAMRLHFKQLVEAMTASSQDTKLNAHRKKVLFEVLSTEASYFQALDTIVEYFYKPFSGAAAKPNNGIITKEEVSAIFGSILEIHKFSKMLLALFDARLQKWPSVQLFGDIFLDHADEMMVYSDYINGFDQATLVLKKCLMNPKFVAFEQECMKATGKRLDLASLLIQPVQRMPRYALLLKELISHSSPEHIDYHNLEEARAKVSDVCATINKKKQEYDNRMQVTQAAGEVIGMPFTLDPTRSLLICQEFVQLEGPDHKHWCRVYLFSDCVVFGKCKTDRSSGSPPPYSHMESFKLVDVGVIGRKGHKRSFLLWDKTAKVSKKGERVLHFSEETVAKKWLKELKEAIETASLQAMLDDEEVANISVEPSRQGHLTLLCASYGDLSNPAAIIDVTSILQKSIVSQGGKSLNLPAQSKASLPGFVDPARGKKKSLLLVYTYGGPPKTRTFMDESPVQITA